MPRGSGDALMMLENEQDKEELDYLFWKAFFNTWEVVEAN